MSTVSAAGHMVQAMTSTGAWSGPTFMLTRGGTNKDTEGLIAPALFRQLDLTTMLDVASAFDTEQEVRDASRLASQKDQDLAVVAWTQSKKRAPYIIAMIARQLTNPDRPTGPTPTAHAPLRTQTTLPPPPPPSFPQVPVEFRPFAAPSAQPDASLMMARDEEVDQVKQHHVDQLLDLYYTMGARGLQWEECSEEERPVQRALLAALPTRLSTPHLRQILLGWERWQQAKPAHADLYGPTATHLGIFLKLESRKGPTVAPSRMRSFKWLRTNLGVPLPVEAVVVKDFIQAPADHTPKQAMSIRPEHF